MSSHPNVELLSISEAAEFLTISESGVRRLIDKRAIPFFKVLGSIRLAREDLLAYLEENRIEPLAK